jgi:hypothetical protein
VTIDEVGNVAAFLCSDLASGVTGEITYVDCGYNIAGIAASSNVVMRKLFLAQAAEWQWLRKIILSY